ncbi:MAG TPA: NTP transferase domain-containing protein, partial [Myxococcales bacterium]
MRLAALIPARYAAQRLPGKPLADIGGAPMVVRVAERAAQARGIDEVAVATDDARIAQAVAAAGFRPLMTDPACRNGTERIAQAARDLPADGYLNVQGDEPLIDPRAIAQVASLVRSGAAMATLARPLQKGEEDLPQVVKVVLDSAGR